MKRFIFILLLPAFVTLASAQKRPNVIYIFTDQQHGNMMSCAGNPWLETNAKDRLTVISIINLNKIKLK